MFKADDIYARNYAIYLEIFNNYDWVDVIIARQHIIVEICPINCISFWPVFSSFRASLFNRVLKSLNFVMPSHVYKNMLKKAQVGVGTELTVNDLLTRLTR